MPGPPAKAIRPEAPQARLPQASYEGRAETGQTGTRPSSPAMLIRAEAPARVGVAQYGGGAGPGSYGAALTSDGPDSFKRRQDNLTDTGPRAKIRELVARNDLAVRGVGPPRTGMLNSKCISRVYCNTYFIFRFGPITGVCAILNKLWISL
jgi:hypothetical protein